MQAKQKSISEFIKSGRTFVATLYLSKAPTCTKCLDRTVNSCESALLVLKYFQNAFVRKGLL